MKYTVYDHNALKEGSYGNGKEIIEQFIEAFYKGDVEKALKIFNEKHLDEAVIVERSINPYDRARCEMPLFNYLVDEICDWSPNNRTIQIEILKRIIENPKNVNIDKPVKRLDLLKGVPEDWGARRPLNRVCGENIPELVEAFLKRDDVDVNAVINFSTKLNGELYETAFTAAVWAAKSHGELEPLVLLLKSGKVDSTMLVGNTTQLDYLKQRKELIAQKLAEKLKEIEPDAQKLAERKARADKAKTVQKPVEPKAPKLFGKKKYEAAMEDYREKLEDYELAQSTINEYEKKKVKYEEKQKLYEEKRAESEKLFKFIEDATKEPSKDKTKDGK